MGVVGSLAIAFTGWMIAWRCGYAPKPDYEVTKAWISNLFVKKGEGSQPVKLSSDEWNISLTLPSETWTAMHPGGDNAIFTVANFTDPECRVVMRAHVMGSMAQSNLDLPKKDGESISELLLRMILTGAVAEKGITTEEKLIGGKKYQYMREEKPHGDYFFRGQNVVECSYLKVENNTAYIFDFVGNGAKAFEKLPGVAEAVLMEVKPMVADLDVASSNNSTYSDPSLLQQETGLSFPNPGPGWNIIPDGPTIFARMRAAAKRNGLSTIVGRSGERSLNSGKLGAPSVGYSTADGDIAGLSVVRLPSQLQPDNSRLVDLILDSWFPETSVDKQNERKFSVGTYEGIEVSGQISSDLTPSPFVFRLVRRGDVIYALGACSFSQKRSIPQLVTILDTAAWTTPKLDLSILNQRYTPPVCGAIWEDLILKLGKELQDANKVEEALDVYREAYETKMSGPMLLAYCEALSMVNQKEKAVAMLEKEWREQTNFSFLPEAATFLARHGKLDSATTLFVTAVQKAMEGQGLITKTMIESYLKELQKAQAHDEALRVIDVLSSIVPSAEWRMWEAYILHNNPKTKARSVEIMEGLIVLVKKNRGLGRDLIRFLKSREAYQLGLEASMGVLRLDPRDGMAWLTRATCERSLGDEEKATATLLKAQEYNPWLRDLDDIVYSITDEEGGPVLTKDGPQAVPISLPTELTKLIRDQPAELKGDPEAPYQYIYRIRSLTYDPGEPFRSTNRYAIRIQTAQGMEQFNILKLPFRPRGVRIQINELRVRLADGKVIAPSTMKEAFITEDNSDGMMTGMKVLNMPVPGLAPGCTLEYTVTEESLGILTGPLTSSFHFASEAPCALDVLYIYSPVAKIDFRHSTGAKPMKLPTGMVWMERDLPALSQEMHQPSLEKFVPVLWTGDGSESWARLGTEYLSLIQSKLKPDEAVVRLAKEKTQQCKTDAERIAVLSQYVRDTLSYAAIEFGMRGLIPNTAMESVKNRYGDCKDHSVLLYQLLRAVGINARLVLANAQTAVQADLPSLGAFNHMITAVPGVRKGAWDFIDCTNKFMAPAADVPPWMLSGKNVLMLGEGTNEFNRDASRLIKINNFPEDFENVTIDRTAQVVDGRHLSVKETITLTGTTACEMRYLTARTSAKKDTSASLKAALGMDRNRFNVTLAQMENAAAVEKPLVIHLEYEIRNGCIPTGDRIVTHLPTHIEMRFLDPDVIGEKRTTPFEFETRLKLVSRTKLYGPDAAALAPSAVEPQDKRFVAWKSSMTNVDGRAEVTLQLTRKPGSFAAKDYAEFQKQLTDATQTVEEATLIPSGTKRSGLTKQQ